MPRIIRNITQQVPEPITDINDPIPVPPLEQPPTVDDLPPIDATVDEPTQIEVLDL